MKIKDIAISLLCVVLAVAVINHLWNTVAVPGQPPAVPQVIIVTVVPDIAPGMATAVPWEEWTEAIATAVMPSPVPDTIIIQAPATWTPAPLPAADEADCKITQTCSTVKNK